MSRTVSYTADAYNSSKARKNAIRWYSNKHNHGVSSPAISNRSTIIQVYRDIDAPP